MASAPNPTEERFLKELRHHIQGWKDKITLDFSPAAFQSEFDDLSNDSLYRRFAFNHPTYVLIRLMGRMSISIGRRLGEIYDKVPRFVAQGRFGLTAAEIGPKVHNELNLDICIPYASPNLSKPDVVHVVDCVKNHIGVDTAGTAGLGIEIRVLLAFPWVRFDPLGGFAASPQTPGSPAEGFYPIPGAGDGSGYRLSPPQWK